MASTNVDLHVRPGDTAHQVLTVFLDGGVHSPAETAGLTGLELAETTRLMAMLTDLRLLEQEQDRWYRPGVALRINTRWSDAVARPEAVSPDRPGVLRALAGIAGGPARIGVLQDGRVSYLRSAMAPTGQGQQELPGFGCAGSLPAQHSEVQQSALGQVLLAYAEDGVALGLLGRMPALAGPARAPERDELDLSLAVVRLSGVAMTRGESSALDIAVPVFKPNGQVGVALEISTGGFPQADAAVLEPLRRIAQRLSV